MTAAEQIAVPEIRIEGVLAEQLWALWPKIGHYFSHFEERSKGEFSAAELLEACCLKQMQYCVAITETGEIRALALTELLKPPFETVVISFCTGEGREDWQDQMVDTIKAWAIDRGSKKLRAVHRPGWKGLLNEMGLRTTHYVSEVEL